MARTRYILAGLVLLAASPAPGQVYVPPGTRVRPKDVYIDPGARVGPRPYWGPLLRQGTNSHMRVAAPTRLDWVFAVPPTSATPAALLMPEYLPVRQSYQLYIPPTINVAQPAPLVLFLSSSDAPAELALWEGTCRQHGVLFAAPYGIGDTAPPARRVRAALDVLDDVRRRFLIDTDRTYIAGSGGGSALACAVGFALPEVFGGVVASGTAGSLRPEPWLRQRVKDRLSVALVGAEGYGGQVVLEQVRLPVLEGAGVRAKLWSHPGTNPLPSPAEVEEVFVWLEQGPPQRRDLATYPAARFADSQAVSAAAWPQALLAEARQRVRGEKTLRSGLMQLEGITRRWPATPAAREAEQMLREHDRKAKVPWREAYREEQQGFAYLEARALSEAVEKGADPLMRLQLRQEALAAWGEVLKQGAETAEGKEAKERVEQLRRLLGGGR